MVHVSPQKSEGDISREPWILAAQSLTHISSSGHELNSFFLSTLAIQSILSTFTIYTIPSAAMGAHIIL